MTSLIDRVSERAKELVLSGGLKTSDAISQSIDEASNQHALHDESSIATNVESKLTGLGTLTPFMQDPEVEELWMNEPNVLYVQTSAGVHRHAVDLGREAQEVLVDRMLRDIGRRVDRTNPFVDATLADGSRLHVVIPDITRRHLSFNIRRYLKASPTLQALGSVTPEQIVVLREALIDRETVLISGATAAGKTTLLTALLGELPPSERIVSAEDTFELAIKNPDWVAMQTRSASIEGEGEIDLRRLIREALRMRPGRLVVGEVRGAEAVELLVALNSGIPALCTIHANSAEHAITKLLTLPLLSGVNVPIEFVKQVIGSTVGLVAHCGLNSEGRRSLRQLVRVEFQQGEVVFCDAA